MANRLTMRILNNIYISLRKLFDPAYYYNVDGTKRFYGDGVHIDGIPYNIKFKDVYDTKGNLIHKLESSIL